MTTPTTIDTNAPVVVRHEIVIDAPVDVVWDLHLDVAGWPNWQHDITDVIATGSLTMGASFTWTSFDFPVTSTVYALEPGRRILWGGTSGGITAIHDWTFEQTPQGATVTTEESLAGPPVDAAADGLRGTLDYSRTSWLRQLAAAAETR
jgi:uncharacterized membrane protein